MTSKSSKSGSKISGLATQGFVVKTFWTPVLIFNDLRLTNPSNPRRRVSAQARIGEPHETSRSGIGMERGHSRAGWLAASRSQFPGQTFSISQPAYRACFASDPGHGRGDTAYFARTPVIASRRKM